MQVHWQHVETIELVNDGSGLGFGIVGGKATGVIVKTILPGGVADQVSYSSRYFMFYTVIQLLLVYFGGDVFRCTPIAAKDLLKAALISTTVIPVGAVIKMFMKNRENDM